MIMNQHQQFSLTPGDGLGPFGMVGQSGHPAGSEVSVNLPGSSMPTNASNAIGTMNNNSSSGMSDLLSAQARERRMLQVLQQQHQQQQQQHLSMATSRGLPVFHPMTTAGTPIAGVPASATHQRFMVDDFAGAGALLSRPEQEFILARSGFQGIGTPAMPGFRGGDGTTLDLSHSSKLADFLIAKQAAVMNGAVHMALHKVTRLPCQARGMKADHNSSVSTVKVVMEVDTTEFISLDFPEMSVVPKTQRYRRHSSRSQKTLVMVNICSVLMQHVVRQG